MVLESRTIVSDLQLYLEILSNISRNIKNWNTNLVDNSNYQYGAQMYLKLLIKYFSGMYLDQIYLSAYLSRDIQKDFITATVTG